RWQALRSSQIGGDVSTILPVQSTVLPLPRNKKPDHDLTARTEDVDSTPAATFFPRLLGRTIGPNLPNTQSRCNLLRLRSLQEITIFRKDIVQRLVHNIVGGCTDDSGVLIDLGGGPFITPNRSTDVADLVDFKQWHLGSPLWAGESTNRFVQNWPESRSLWA